MFNKMKNVLSMRNGRYWVSFFVFLSVPAAITTVYAGDEANAVGEGNVPVPKKLSPEEQMRWVRDKTVSAEKFVELTVEKLEKAKEEKDTLRITCLDDKLTQLNVTVGGIEERTKSLETSIKRGNIVAAEQNFAILKIYVERVFKLREASENCLGEADVVLGKTKTMTTVSEDISLYDPEDPKEMLSMEIGTAPPNELSGHL